MFLPDTLSLFYMPGTLIGAFVVDYLGPKWTMITGLLFQAFFGFIMSGLYGTYVFSSLKPIFHF
jgi:hypothetical protein